MNAFWVSTFLFLWAYPCCADVLPCATLKAKIVSELRANGVESYSIDIIDRASAGKGRVVGTCDGGKQKVMYARDLRVELSSVPKSTSNAQPVAALPSSPSMNAIPVGSTVLQELSIEENNFRQLKQWKSLVESVAKRAIDTNDASLYRSATAFRDQLLPYNRSGFGCLHSKPRLLSENWAIGEGCRVIHGDARRAQFEEHVVARHGG